MKVTDVRIRKINPDKGNIKAFASITLDDVFCVHDITVTQGPMKMYVNMPSKKKKEANAQTEKILDIAHPLTSELRNEITQAVLDAYDKAVD